jgi:hypothetical protein
MWGKAIATGWLVGVEHGRRSYHGELCIAERPDDELSPGACAGWEADYSSHVKSADERPEDFSYGTSHELVTSQHSVRVNRIRRVQPRASVAHAQSAPPQRRTGVDCPASGRRLRRPRAL